MIKMKSKTKACTGSAKCHCFCLLQRISETCLIRSGSSGGLPVQ
ncbi:hypothetical protein OIU74_024866, partial [Salix koriyanagi]